jgi:hypothetical protein
VACAVAARQSTKRRTKLELENLARDMDAGDIAEAERSASEWLVLHQSVEAMGFHFKLLH